MTPYDLLFVADIFEKYTRHLCLKYKANGYQRLELRMTYQPLKIYDQAGKFIRETSPQELI